MRPAFFTRENANMPIVDGAALLASMRPAFFTRENYVNDPNDPGGETLQ